MESKGYVRQKYTKNELQLVRALGHVTNRTKQKPGNMHGEM